MSTEKEIVISFTKLIIPKQVHLTKTIVSVQFQKNQLFIQKERLLKDHRVNLFRECIFIPNITKKISFRVYSVSDYGLRTFLQEIKVPANDLQSINTRTTLMTSSSQGFELVWQAWIFSDESDDLNSQTDRDYSELNIPFKSEEEQTESQVSKNSKDMTTDSQLFVSDFILLKKRSTEVDSSFFSQIDKHFSERLLKTNMPSCETLFKHFDRIQPTTRNKTKAEICAKLVKDISDYFFCQSQAK